MFTPTPRAPRQNQSSNVESSHWVREFLAKGAPRSRKSSLPIMGVIIAGVILPYGVNLWTPNSAVADTDVSTPATTQSSPTQSASQDNAQTSPESASQYKAITPLSAAVDSVQAAASSVQETVQDAIAELPQNGNVWHVTSVVGGVSTTQEIKVPVAGASVSEVLELMQITLNPLDRIDPPLKNAASDNMTVRVQRVTAELEKSTKYLDFETRYQPNNNLKPGQKQTVQKGVKGQVEITERVWTLDGKETMRQRVARRDVSASQPEVIGLGSKAAYVPSKIPYHNRYARSMSLSARGGSPRDRFQTPKMQSYKAERSIELVATGYSPDPRENGGYTTTATGLPIGYGAAAVDPRVIPLGTKLYVEGYGYALACDTGGAIKGKRIDLAYDSYRLANTKGRKKVRVWILER